MLIVELNSTLDCAVADHIAVSEVLSNDAGAGLVFL